MATVVYRDPYSLHDNPENHGIYGDDADEELVASVRLHGIVTPLLILRDDTLVSGHRRRDAAIKAGLQKVPCRLNETVDPADWVAVTELLLEENRYRDKNNEQKAAEFAVRKEIEAEKAKRRMEAGVKADPPENLPEGSGKGDSRDKAAEAVGWSGRTAEKAAKVKDAIKAAEEKGDTDRAAALRRALIASVDRAYKMLDKPTKTKRRSAPKKPKAATTTQLLPDDNEAPEQVSEPVAPKEDDPDDRIGSLLDQLSFWTAKRAKMRPSPSHYMAMMDAIDGVTSAWHIWIHESK